MVSGSAAVCQPPPVRPCNSNSNARRFGMTGSDWWCNDRDVCLTAGLVGIVRGLSSALSLE